MMSAQDTQISETCAAAAEILILLQRILNKFGDTDAEYVLGPEVSYLLEETLALCKIQQEDGNVKTALPMAVKLLTAAAWRCSRAMNEALGKLYNPTENNPDAPIGI